MTSSLIEELGLDDLISDRFSRYSKYIIQDRALPDIRDGLKPVQRRILFAMYKEGNTHEAPFRKSAKTVGNVIGNYHPHGDSSVYEAMVRMSQDWKLNHVLIEMHGNNGSMDGDPAAAMRYTEARLSPIANELLTSIDKDTVPRVLNFDDTLEEPVVLPANYPNLLVNGATGISAGYATDIPPHNLGEVIDACLELIKHPEASLKSLLKKVKGPDFPTGGIIEGAENLESIYRTGKGKIVVRSKTSIEQLKGDKAQIVVTEIPYEVNKASLVKKIDDIRINRQIEGIADVRDESDRTGLRIAIELKKEANPDAVLDYLLKKTDLRVNYTFNMVAISDQHPKQVGLKEILSAYIRFKEEVVTRKTEFEKRKAEKRLHLVDGLIKAISVLDEVIEIIRASENKSAAKKAIMERFDFSDLQAEAIVSLRLYRLTNTDIQTLQNERLDLNESIAYYQGILNDQTILHQVISQELKAIKKSYALPRQTEVQEKIQKIVIEEKALIAQEELMVMLTKQGYYKRTSLRSYQSTAKEGMGIREGDYPVFLEQMTTTDNLVILTSFGKFISLPVHYLPDAKWKDLGGHLSANYNFEAHETIQAVYRLPEVLEKNLLVATRYGQIKQVPGDLFDLYRTNKSQVREYMTFKHEEDQITHVSLHDKESSEAITLVTRMGFGLKFLLEEVSTVGLKASGVIACNLKKGDEVVNIISSLESRVNLLTQKALAKGVAIKEIPMMKRAIRGIRLLAPLKRVPHEVIFADALGENEKLEILWPSSDEKAPVFLDKSNFKGHSPEGNGDYLNELSDLSQVLLFKTKTENFSESLASNSPD